MHKKLFTAVLALGLLFLTAPLVNASNTPHAEEGTAIPVNVHVQGLQPPPSARATLTPTLSASGPMVTIQAGSNRTVPGTFCDGAWQAAWSGYYFGGWFEGFEPAIALTYQDPNTLGSCAPGSNYTFDVTAVTVGMATDNVITGAKFRAVIFDVDLTNPACPVPGNMIHMGAEFGVTFPTVGGGAYFVTVPFDVEACVTGPYFAGVMASDPNFDYMDLGVGIDYPDGTGVTCADYANDKFGTINESGWYNFWTGAYGTNLIISSEGYTPDDPATHCNPGACVWEDYYTGAANDSAGSTVFGYFLPSASATTGRDKIGTVISAVGLDTLKACSVFVAFANSGPMSDMLLEILALDGTPSGCGPRPTYAGTVLYSQVIPGAILNDFDFTYVPLTTPFIFGTLNGGPTQQVLVSLTSLMTADQMLGYSTPADATCGTGHSMLRMQAGLNDWYYFGEGAAAFAARQHHEQLIRFEWCREVLPAVESECGAGGPDEWTSYAHDNQQTSASSINVGEPQEVTLKWTKALPRVSNFTNPTVANDIIYISSDLELNAYDLATSAPVGTLAGTPEMGSSNRGNATVAYVAALSRDVVFATGGNFNAITALETNLETSPKIWSNNTVTMPPLGLGQQNRFNTSKVVDVAGTDVLFVCTEPASGTGLLFAFNAATGALYPGWATNPVVLDAAAKHGPAVNGGKLYVGTAIGGSNVDGTLYQIDAATGAIDWTFVGTNDASEGWPSGVSTEGDFLYGATLDINNVGVRYKIDKSSGAPVVVWSAAQGKVLYGTPTIGSSFVYFPLDNPNFGILQVDKGIGTVARNFSASSICGVSVGMIPQHLTLSCDAYLFAGDRQARWWMFDAQSGDAMWYREFPVFNGGEIVSGTALVSHSGGDNYAVVAVRQLGGLVGQISAYQLNAGPRPRLIQCLHDATILVPFGTVSGNPHSEPGAFLNVGNAPLNFTAVNVADPAPDGLAQARRDARDFRDQIMNAVSSSGADGYNSYLSAGSELTKMQRMAGLGVYSDGGEWLTAELSFMESREQLLSTRSQYRSMAAGAATIRTGNIQINGAAVPTSLASAAIGDLSWDYDGTGLERGQDLNVMEFTVNDPDFNYDAVNNGGISVAEFSVLYIGGCLIVTEDTVSFNTDGSYHALYNAGGLGENPTSAATHEWNFVADAHTPNEDFFDGGLILAGDSVAGGLAPDYGARFFADYYTCERFAPNVNPITGVCGTGMLSNVLLGAKRTGGCPGTPADIMGDIGKSDFVDTNFLATPGTPGAALGLRVIQTEVAAHDPLYGDFTLIHYDVTNRDAVAKGPIYPAWFTDWDINSGNNTGIVSDVFNGYVMWDPAVATNTIGYGYLNPDMPHTYSGVDPVPASPYKLWVIDNPTMVYATAGGWWAIADDVVIQRTWSDIVNGTPRAVWQPSAIGDKSGLLVNKPLYFDPNGSASTTMAIFGVDATSNSAATIEANAAGLAKRAARWGGFARGDVNDDGLVDLADVCWLQGGHPIYPAAYSGDVNADGLNDAADIARLLSFVSGNAGDQPAGAWRF